MTPKTDRCSPSGILGPKFQLLQAKTVDPFVLEELYMWSFATCTASLGTIYLQLLTA